MVRAWELFEVRFIFRMGKVGVKVGSGRPTVRSPAQPRTGGLPSGNDPGWGPTTLTGQSSTAVTSLPHPPCSGTAPLPGGCCLLLGLQGPGDTSPSSVASTVRLCQTWASRSRDTAVRMVPSSGSMEKQRSRSEWGRMEYLGRMESSWGWSGGRATACCPPPFFFLSFPPSVPLLGLTGHLGRGCKLLRQNLPHAPRAITHIGSP